MIEVKLPTLFFNNVDFSQEDLQHLYETDLANQLGNLVQRISKSQFYQKSLLDEANYSQHSHLHLVTQAYDQLKFHHGILLVMEMVQSLNAYISAEKPWEALDDPERMGKIMNHVHKELNLICLLLYPIIPAGVDRIMQRLRNLQNNIIDQTILFPRNSKF